MLVSGIIFVFLIVSAAPSYSLDLLHTNANSSINEVTGKYSKNLNGSSRSSNFKAVTPEVSNVIEFETIKPVTEEKYASVDQIEYTSLKYEPTTEEFIGFINNDDYSDYSNSDYSNFKISELSTEIPSKTEKIDIGFERDPDLSPYDFEITTSEPSTDGTREFEEIDSGITSTLELYSTVKPTIGGPFEFKTVESVTESPSDHEKIESTTQKLSSFENIEPVTETNSEEHITANIYRNELNGGITTGSDSIIDISDRKHKVGYDRATQSMGSNPQILEENNSTNVQSDEESSNNRDSNGTDPDYYDFPDFQAVQKSPDYYEYIENKIMTSFPKYDQDHCTNRACLRKCCRKGEILSYLPPDVGCIPAGDLESNWQVPEQKDSSGNVVLVDSSLPVVVGGLECESGDYGEVTPLEPANLMHDGRLFSQFDNATLDHSLYCMEVVRYDEDFVQFSTLRCYGAFQPDLTYLIRDIGIPYLSLVSVIFLLLLVGCHVLVPSFRDMQGMCRFNHALSMLVYYSFITASNILPFQFPFPVCFCIGVMIHASNLALFFWFSVLCFDIWRYISLSLSGKTLVAIKDEDKAFYKAYQIFGWGGPALVMAVSLSIDLLPEESVPSWVLQPRYGETRCYLKDRREVLIAYYFGMVGVLMFFNMSFILHTSYLLYKNGVAFACISKVKDKFFSIKKKTNLPKTFQATTNLGLPDDQARKISTATESDISSQVTNMTNLSTDMMSDDLKRKISTTSNISSQITSTSIFPPDKNSNHDVAVAVDQQNVPTHRPQAGCNFKDMKRRSMKSFNTKFVSLFWQRFQLFSLLSLCWSTEVLSYFIPPMEIWIPTDLLNSLQGLFLFIIFFRVKKNRMKVKEALKSLKDKCGCCP